MLDYLCDGCKEHFEQVKTRLTSMGIDYTVNPTIVRGLDYYTRTVFEFVSTEIGAQGTVCAGGRYDGLVSEMGGPELPSLGFGMGLERLLMLMEKQGCEFPPVKRPDIYIAPMGAQAELKAEEFCSALRREGFAALTDLNGRGLKAQMKYAGKLNARYVVVLGENELNEQKARLKNMDTSKERDIDLKNIVKEFYSHSLDDSFAAMEESVEKM